MKTCTLFEVAYGQPGRVIEVSFVEDDHEFGLSKDETRLHMPGELTGLVPDSEGHREDAP